MKISAPESGSVQQGFCSGAQRTIPTDKRRYAPQHEQDHLQRFKEEQFALFLGYTSGYFR